MAPLSQPERRDFWEIYEDRYKVRSTILTSQLPVSRWHEQIADPTLADGILDRLVHNAHRIEMRTRCARIGGNGILLFREPVLAAYRPSDSRE
jgi:DNA replication protein DnaC